MKRAFKDNYYAKGNNPPEHQKLVSPMKRFLTPLEVGVQSTKALVMAGFCTRSGGTIIWVAPQKEAGPIMPLVREMASAESAGDFHRRLIQGDVPDHLKSFGISYIMQVVYFKKLAEKFAVIHVTEGRIPPIFRRRLIGFQKRCRKRMW
ncbi:MAG: hypothetical protein ABSB22_06770 [Thermodesulfobacteriota bacterium]